jgi:hypothetical protein
MVVRPRLARVGQCQDLALNQPQPTSLICHMKAVYAAFWRGWDICLTSEKSRLSSGAFPSCMTIDRSYRYDRERQEDPSIARLFLPQEIARNTTRSRRKIKHALDGDELSDYGQWHISHGEEGNGM